ncbi:hypothetical protein Sme01_46350 [Sphaerisporangium melleum]|uniref:Secreted protein n=1 Tax=Sphaerisporangium melleum TaxID=321316 RepID=A0A917VNG2_9ACTN|nr:hypothetical protein GCM10007964_49760 [Sphaerisporangium melleum]GII72159.1 hypothetical protein Sme01_46350 [Sphaerisporangium melleum]
MPKWLYTVCLPTFARAAIASTLTLAYPSLKNSSEAAPKMASRLAGERRFPASCSMGTDYQLPRRNRPV